jgi:hypothetical protein
MLARTQCPALVYRTSLFHVKRSLLNSLCSAIHEGLCYKARSFNSSWDAVDISTVRCCNIHDNASHSSASLHVRKYTVKFSLHNFTRVRVRVEKVLQIE